MNDIGTWSWLLDDEERAAFEELGDLRAAGDVVGHEFHGNQWTKIPSGGLKLDKDGYDAEGKPGPEFAQRGGALWLYRGSGTDINDQLRADDVTEPEVRDTLDSLMRPIGKDTTLIRDLGFEVALKPGTTIIEKGYTSTASKRGTFAKGQTIKIDVPAHAPVIRVGDYYAKDSEHEVILARGSKFEVISPTHLRWIGTDFKALEYDESKHPRDERGQWTDTGGSSGEARGRNESWPAGLKKLGGPSGSNPGGLFKDKSGQKWYVKNYKDPRQGQTEHIANEIYRAVGVNAPQSVLGEGGAYASKIIEGDGTLAQAGLTKERANAILDGFAADVFLDNWDAVGTGHDNILVSGKQVSRIDQGGTLLFRAQGALKPESGLDKIDEWNSLVDKNHYYAQVFNAAGIKNGDALGERAAKQIDAIVAARPAGGWKELVDKVAPEASPAFREKVASVLEKRQALLEQKRDELRGGAGAKESKGFGATGIFVTSGGTNSASAEELAVRSAATLKALGTAPQHGILRIQDDAKERAELIKAIGSGPGLARAQKEYAETPIGDLRVLKSIRVEDHPVSGQAHCTYNREVVMGSTSAIGDFRHELGHAIHMSMSPELQSRAEDLYKESRARAVKNPAGIEKKLDHEFYEKNYGIIGRRGLDNWHENFAEHYRGYHKAIYQTRHGEDTDALNRYTQRFPKWSALWDAHYAAMSKPKGKK